MNVNSVVRFICLNVDVTRKVWSLFHLVPSGHNLSFLCLPFLTCRWWVQPTASWIQTTPLQDTPTHQSQPTQRWKWLMIPSKDTHTHVCVCWQTEQTWSELLVWLWPGLPVALSFFLLRGFYFEKQRFRRCWLCTNRMLTDSLCVLKKSQWAVTWAVFDWLQINSSYMSSASVFVISSDHTFGLVFFQTSTVVAASPDSLTRLAKQQERSDFNCLCVCNDFNFLIMTHVAYDSFDSVFISKQLHHNNI